VCKCLPIKLVSYTLALVLTCANSSIASENARYLALGDSYTIGESVKQNQRWPVQLATRLTEHGVAIDKPVIIARTGWTSGQLLAAIERKNPLGTFDLVSLMIGVNNQYRHRSLAEFRSEFRLLLQKAQAFAGDDAKRLIVLSIPNWGVTPYGQRFNPQLIGDDIERFNKLCREETTRIGAQYVNITALSEDLAEDRSYTAADGLHPSAKLYKAWVDEVFPRALEVLSP